MTLRGSGSSCRMPYLSSSSWNRTCAFSTVIRGAGEPQLVVMSVNVSGSCPTKRGTFVAPRSSRAFKTATSFVNRLSESVPRNCL